MKSKGVIAAGHAETAKAGRIILEEGGNAFDAALGALCAACVAEPVLASLGGGGFLLARPGARGGKPVLYDFFAQTPRHRRDRSEVDFSPIIADFGPAEQEFHIGRGTIATPGVVKGLFEAHKDLGKMPMAKIVEPAIKLAKDGVRINRLQDYIFTVVEKIYTSNKVCLSTYGAPDRPGKLAGEGDVLVFADLADTLDSLAREGEALFYRGEIAATLADDCLSAGGHLRRDDLEGYQLVRRKPFEMSYGNARILTNPPPSMGGILIGFALTLLAEVGLGGGKLGGEKFGGKAHLQHLLSAMMLTNEARIESNLHEGPQQGSLETLLDPDFMETYRRRILGRPQAKRGTTHISVIDRQGNAAALSVSNGEGSAYIVPGTGVMMNNMLGEEDINPHGFNQWPEDIRMTSMMSPSLIEGGNGEITALGSGGSNRIRTAILQVIVNLIDFRMPLSDAIESPRIHFEKGLLSLEDGFGTAELAALRGQVGDIKSWGERNMFFGGVHAAHFEPTRGHMQGAGDPRRGGIAFRI